MQRHQARALLAILGAIMVVSLSSALFAQDNPEHNRHRTFPITLVWSVSFPAGSYFGTFNAFPGPFSQIHLDHGIRLTRLAFNIQVLPSFDESACAGAEADVLNPNTGEFWGVAFSDLVPVIAGPNNQNGFFATKDLRSQKVIIPAGADLWVQLAPGQPGCTLTVPGNLTVQYEGLDQSKHDD